MQHDEENPHHFGQSRVVVIRTALAVWEGQLISRKGKDDDFFNGRLWKFIEKTFNPKEKILNHLTIKKFGGIAKDPQAGRQIRTAVCEVELIPLPGKPGKRIPVRFTISMKNEEQIWIPVKIKFIPLQKQDPGTYPLGDPDALEFYIS